MLSIEEINNTIEELENGNTTFDACIKLSALYNVRDRLTNKLPANETEDELNDILPQYKMYCTIKKKYQMHELTEEAVLLSMADVCKEITEFIETMYSSTDMQDERTQITDMLTYLQGKLV